jgi:hypothetical protein
MSHVRAEHGRAAVERKERVWLHGPTARVRPQPTRRAVTRPAGATATAVGTSYIPYLRASER